MTSFGRWFWILSAVYFVFAAGALGALIFLGGPVAVLGLVAGIFMPIAAKFVGKLAARADEGVNK